MLKTFIFCPLVWAVVCSALVSVHGAPAMPEAQSGESVNIRGGEPAAPGEYPFIVSLQLKGRSENPNEHICGATLYNMSRIITAASCVRSRVTSNFVVVAGAHTMNEAILGHQQSRNVRQITHHPNFDPVAEIVRDDIAVIDLASPFESSETVAPIPMARRSQQYSTVCVIAGWGPSNYSGANSEMLIKGNVTIHSRDFCAKAYPQWYDENFQICANGVNGKGELVDACGSDLGGPLICSNDDGSLYLAGISSYGHMCGSPERPGVYMEIAKYRNWLDSLTLGGTRGTTTTTTTESTRTSSSKPSNDPIDDSSSGNDDTGSAAAQEDQVDNKPVKGLCRTIKSK